MHVGSPLCFYLSLISASKTTGAESAFPVCMEAYFKRVPVCVVDPVIPCLCDRPAR